MTEAPMFAFLLLVLMAGVVADVVFCRKLQRRGWLHVALAVIFLAVMLTMPRCGDLSEAAPDAEAPPYRY